MPKLSKLPRLYCQNCGTEEDVHLFRYTTGSGGTSWLSNYCWTCRWAQGVDAYHAWECLCALPETMAQTIVTDDDGEI